MKKYFLTPIIILLVNFGTTINAVMTTETTIYSSGTISIPNVIQITFKYSEGIGTNKLVVGSQIHYWMETHKNSILRQQISASGSKIIRFFINYYAGTEGFGNYDPCRNWDAATKTGTWDWSLFDYTMNAIYDSGARPMICFNFKGSIRPSGMPVDPDVGLPPAEHYAEYARAVAEHVKEKGWSSALWEAFNEVHTQWTYYPSSDIYTPENQAKWNKIVSIFNNVSESIHGVIPSAKVGETSTMYKGWCETIAEKGLGVAFIGHHKYDSGNAPEEYADDQELFRRATNAKGYDLPDILWTPEDALDFFAQHGKNPEFYYTETGLNHDWSPQDIRKFTPLGAVWYATELIDFAKGGISLSLFYEMASNMGSSYPQGFGMVELWGSHSTWYPYYTTILFANNLFPGDGLKRCFTSSPSISCLAWSHGSEYKILLVHKTPENETVSVNFEELSAEVSVKRLEYIGDPYIGALDSQFLGIYNNSFMITMNGYGVILVSLTPT
jgi:hypothetical protein